MVDIQLEIPVSFFEEEIREGYKVSREMKEVWAVELDLLNEFLSVCKKYGLKCYADAGTLLGTVRHAGFIPWDDDIDLIMFRDDYERLCEVVEEAFSHPYFFQTVQTDEEYFRGHAQFRNSDTTGILEHDWKQGCKFNQGIFIDIFILDGVLENSFLLKIQKKITGIIKRLMVNNYKKRNERHWYVNIMWDCLNGFRITTKKLDKLYHACFRKVSLEKSERVAPLSFIFETEKRIRGKHLYDETIWLPFEFMKIPVPAGYDEFLRGRYGDYKKPTQIPTTHGGVIFDTSKSYREYLK